jgi:hypothetical protein
VSQHHLNATGENLSWRQYVDAQEAARRKVRGAHLSPAFNMVASSHEWAPPQLTVCGVLGAWGAAEKGHQGWRRRSGWRAVHQGEGGAAGAACEAGGDRAESDALARAMRLVQEAKERQMRHGHGCPALPGAPR